MKPDSKKTEWGKKTNSSLYINWDEGTWGVVLPSGLNGQIGGRIGTREVGRSIEWNGPVTLTFWGKLRLIFTLIVKIWNL